ncbi:hypothetical protein EOD39_11953 [Acipenser ruthenus]|uniref:Uncharacterized protein n=1 Tax=Acipenser ruthenus TaxID=7906 RepID=A0A444TWA2_ACIRT|nr:hypothetical protein EOD39_11953 [Acipenser ruthenus]
MLRMTDLMVNDSGGLVPFHCFQATGKQNPALFLPATCVLAIGSTLHIPWSYDNPEMDSKGSAMYKSVYMKDYEARYPIRPSYLGQVPLRRLGQVQTGNLCGGVTLGVLSN